MFLFFFFSFCIGEKVGSPELVLWCHPPQCEDFISRFKVAVPAVAISLYVKEERVQNTRFLPEVFAPDVAHITTPLRPRSLART